MKTLIGFLCLASAAVVQCLPYPNPQMSMGMGNGMGMCMNGVCMGDPVDSTSGMGMYMGPGGMAMSPMMGFPGMQPMRPMRPMQPMRPMKPLKWFNITPGSGGMGTFSASGSSSSCGPGGCRSVHYIAGPGGRRIAVSGPPGTRASRAGGDDWEYVSVQSPADLVDVEVDLDGDGDIDDDDYQEMLERQAAERAAAKKAQLGKKNTTK